VRGSTGGNAEGRRERNTRARAKHDGRHAESARLERKRTREAAGRGAEMCVRGECARPLTWPLTFADQRF
jgi:hypothetical protein